MFEQKWKKISLFNLLKIIKQHSNNLKIPKLPKKFQASQVENINISKEFSISPIFLRKMEKNPKFQAKMVWKTFIQCEQFNIRLNKPHHNILSIPFVWRGWFYSLYFNDFNPQIKRGLNGIKLSLLTLGVNRVDKQYFRVFIMSFICAYDLGWMKSSKQLP
jgi:hypothetical protein